MELSIVIPAYNEENRIGPTLKKICKYLRNNKKIKKWEILVIDDGSKDKTREIVKQFIKKEKRIKLNEKRKNEGKGFSVREGALMSKFSNVLFTDADLSTPIEELNNFIPYSDNYDIIIGSRSLKESNIKEHQPKYREIMGKIFNFSVRIITGLDIKDTQCGFKLFKNCKELFLEQKIKGFSFDVELLYLAFKKKKRILELPVTWINSKKSKVNPIKDSIKMFFDILKIKYLHKN